MAADHRAHVNWTPELDALLGTMSDDNVAKIIGFTSNPVRDRRKKLGIPTYRSTRGEIDLACATCGRAIRRKSRDRRRSKRLFCSKACANSAQKKRDSEALRYGPGWKKLRREIRARDRVCRVCAKTPAQNGSALHVHHIKPFRIGGTNHPDNLVALCETCHHLIEAATTQALDSIPIDVSLEGSLLTICLAGQVVSQRSCAPGASGQTEPG
jgi:5-methylcytosine-specific restriction endonuclease McrA